MVTTFRTRLLFIVVFGLAGTEVWGQTPVDDADWGLTFTPPEGWTTQKETEGYLVHSASAQTTILVVPHPYADADALRRALEEPQVLGGATLVPEGPAARFAERGWEVAYRAEGNGTVVQAHVVGLVAPEQQGVMVTALAPAAAFTQQIVEQTRAVAASVRIHEAAETPGFVAEWTERLQGCRLTHTETLTTDYFGTGYRSKTVIDLCPAGHFRYESTDAMSAQAGGGFAHQRDGDKGAGQWQIRSMAGQPALTLTFPDGSVYTYRLRRTNDQLFLNDVRFFRTCDPYDPYEAARPACP